MAFKQFFLLRLGQNFLARLDIGGKTSLLLGRGLDYQVEKDFRKP